MLPKKQLLKYKRADGVELSANLYLPPGYKPGDGPLPTLMEAYPTEYKTRSAAGQIRGSPYEFPFLYWGSPVPFATQGYAVLESATVPIVGEGDSEPNDTYVEQLVASANCLPPVECSPGTTPSQAANPRPFLKAAPLPMAAMVVFGLNQPHLVVWSECRDPSVSS